MNTDVTKKDCEICPLLVGQTAADDNVILQTERWVAVLDRKLVRLMLLLVRCFER